jgi:hypothetical protein
LPAGMQGDEESSGGDEDGEQGASEDHPMEDESLQAFEGHGGALCAIMHQQRNNTPASLSALLGCLASPCSAHALHAAVAVVHMQLQYTDASMLCAVMNFPADAVLAVAWSPTQPDLVATGGQDDKAFLWRVSWRTCAKRSVHVQAGLGLSGWQHKQQAGAPSLQAAPQQQQQQSIPVAGEPTAVVPAEWCTRWLACTGCVRLAAQAAAASSWSSWHSLSAAPQQQQQQQRSAPATAAVLWQHRSK